MDIDIKYIERYWQKVWEDESLFTPEKNSSKPKFFNFDSAPFPNGNLHLGHVRNYVLGDVIARYKRLNGFNVLYTTNFDSFGLPNQLEAEKQSKKPEQYTKECILRIKTDLKHLGISYDWSRVNSTSHPEYYKWTQWLFLELHSAGLVYRKNTCVNWCNTCDSVLANMEVEAGKCTRCNNNVEQKHIPQWFIALSKYSPELHTSIDTQHGWSNTAKKLVKGFIGKTTGTLVLFPVSGQKEAIEVFIPEKYKLEHVTFVTAAKDAIKPEILVGVIQKKNSPAQELKSIPVSKRRRNKRDLESKTGLDSGIKLIHPIYGVSIPLFYVNHLPNETGSQIKAGAPSSSPVDKIFSEKYNIPEINKSIQTSTINTISTREKSYYHVHDWVVSRQKKWGTPLPMVKCPDCGFVPVEREKLPVIRHFDETCKNTSNSKCPVCNKDAEASHDTLDCYIDDVWCFLSSELHSKNDFSLERAHNLDWFPADHYHAGYDIHMYLHLYRFITRFLYKRGYVKTPEPITVHFGHDMVLQDGKKMSKRHNNSQNMQQLVDRHGADIVRIAMLLLANPDRPVRWDNNEMLKRSRKLVFKLLDLGSLLIDMKDIKVMSEEPEFDTLKKSNLAVTNIQLNTEITKYIDGYRPGSAIQLLEKHTKKLYKIISSLSANGVSRADYLYLKKHVLTLCILYSPFMPHISEEVWHRLGGERLVAQAKWPVCLGIADS